ncbi:MAG: hypothetical protein AAF389_02895 [Gemmatimonadota bacterium]
MRRGADRARSTFFVRRVWLVTAFAFASCIPGRVGPGVSGLVQADPGDGALRLTYLGTGGWIMEHGADMVLGAPLFSNPSFLGTGLGVVRADTAAIDRGLAPYDIEHAAAVLVGHAHYDHLMDVPRTVLEHTPDARILGSRTVQNTLGLWSGVGHLVDRVEPHVADVESEGEWMRYGPRIRVLPLKSWHAPHFDGLTLYRGTADVPRRAEPTRAGEWLDGFTVAFLIDFLDDDGTIAHRIYYQDAVTQAPWGFAPVTLIAERPVDVAILVPATFDQVDWHPEAFVENLQPKRILLGHWEDFFIPVDEETRSVMLADMDHFEARLRRVFDGEFWRPDLGTVFELGRTRPEGDG